MRTFPHSLSCLLLLATSAWAAEVQIDSASGAPTRLILGQQQLPLATAGGFVVRDFQAGKDIPLTGGQTKIDREKTVFTAEAGDYSVQATFVPTGDVIEVSGEITSKRPEESAVLLRYTLPLPPEGATVEEDFTVTQKLPSSQSLLGTVYPLIAQTTSGWGAALSIPPAAAICFGLTGSNDGLAVEFYLGLSPVQKSSPNKAAFHFTISAATPGWGFRSALEAYQKRYPEYYKPAFTPQGLWLWSERGAIESVLHLYQTHSITRTRDFDAHLDRDKKAGIRAFDYLIVGQRELRKLPVLPATDEAALKEFATFAAAWKSEGPDGPLHKMYSHWRDRDLPAQIERCAIGKSDGELRLRIRETVWAGNSITFIMNPSPYLFEDQKVPTVGSMTLDQVRQWIAEEPRLDGIHVDSLGAQWPSWLNYRKDHEAYARYPLTFSPRGQVAVHNHLSHCEFLDELRALLHQNGKLVLGNGLYRYSRGEGSEIVEENYNGNESSRFFEAARLDASVREFEKLPPRDDLEFFRACMGNKYYGGILYQWSDPELVRRFMNRALVYTLFAAPHKNGNRSGRSYLEAEDGYPRDQELLTWFLENARLLAAAGWQPVTEATVNQPDVGCERYGQGGKVYFALNNFAEQTLETELTIDLAALGFDPAKVRFAHPSDTKPAEHPVKVEGTVARVSLKLAPDTAHIVAISQ